MRRDEVDLLVVEAVLCRHRHGNEEDPEQVVAVGVDPRARLVVVDVRREERAQRRRVHVLGQSVMQLDRGGVDEVEPPGHDSSVRGAADV